MNKIKLSLISLGVLGLGIRSTSIKAAEKHDKKPNIIIFLVDDMGWKAAKWHRL